MSPQGRPKGEYRSALRDDGLVSPRDLTASEYRSALRDDGRTSARRPLGDTMAEVGSSVLDALAQRPELGVHGIECTLPIEFALHGRGAATTLLGDVPRCVRRTAFDVAPGQVRFLCTARMLR